MFSNTKTSVWIKSSIYIGIIAGAVFTPEVYAVAPTDPNSGISKLKKDLIDYFVQNATYIGAISMAAGGAVLAFGGEIKKVIANNMGYVGYLAFAPVVIGGAVAALGALI